MSPLPTALSQRIYNFLMICFFAADKFCGPVLEDEEAFEGKVNALCRELGHRGLLSAEID